MDRGLGYLPDPPDGRDRSFASRRLGTLSRPRAVHTYELVRASRDQSRTNSCVGNGAATALELRRVLDGEDHIAFSASAIYWHTRARDGLHERDAGSHIRSAMHCMHRVGVPLESAHPFAPETIQDRPGLDAEAGGLVFADGVYERVTSFGAQRVEDVLDALAAGDPIIFGTDVTEAFQRHRGSGTLPAPREDDRMLGGHAIVACGYMDGGDRIRIVNSWGTGWGHLGQAWLASEWLTVRGTRDIWALRRSRVEL